MMSYAPHSGPGTVGETTTSPAPARRGGGRDLHSLCRDGRVEDVRRLLKRDTPSVDGRKGSYGLTPLQEACRMDRPAVCLELLNYGAEFNETTTEGRFTALHLSAWYRHYRCIENLLLHSKRSLKLHFKNADGKTAIQLAQEKKYRDVVRIIRCGEIYQLAKDKAAVDYIRSILEKLQGEERFNGECSTATEQIVHKLIDKSLSDAASDNNIRLVGYLLQFGIEKPECLLNSFKIAKNAGFLEVAAILILSYNAFKHETDEVRYLLAPQIEVENNEFLIVGQHQQWRDLVYPLHSKKSINISIAMRVALQKEFEDTAGEILLQTECDVNAGTVDWHGLGLTYVADNWLLRQAHVFRSHGSSIHHSISALGEWVTSLNLSVNYLRGVPQVVCRLKNLQHLELSENYIGGAETSDPENRSGLPVELFALKKLKRLRLSKVHLTEFPDVPQWSSTLIDLNLAGNSLKTLPRSFGDAASLQFLSLSDNLLGKVPRCVGSLTKLVSLSLAGNVQIKELPLELGRLSELITLDTKKLSISNVPETHQRRAAATVKYLNRRLRSLEPQRVAKIVVVGESHDRRQLMMKELQRHDDCPPGLFDLGNLDTFWLFMRALEAKHTHFVLVWDLDRDEAVDGLIPFFQFLRKRLPHGMKTTRSPPRLQVLLAAVHVHDVPREDIVQRVNAKLGQHKILCSLMPVIPEPLIVNLTPAHKDKSIKEVLSTLAGFDSTFLTIEEVPHCHVSLRDRLTHNKRQLSTPLAKTAWMLEKHQLFAKINSLMKDPANELVESNWDEMRSLLSFLQHDGNILHIPFPGSAFDNIYFFTPQWLFRSLLDAFGPTARPPLGFASNTTGLFRRRALGTREMFGPGSPRAKLGDFAMQLGTFFGLAYPVQGDMMFLPFKLPPDIPHDVRLKFIASIHSASNHMRFFSAVGDMPWPLGFFPLLQSYVMDNLVELTQDCSAERPRSFTEALSWGTSRPRRQSSRHFVSRSKYSLDFELSRHHRLTLWRHGMAGWREGKLIFALFQKSSVNGAFPHVKDLDDVGTLCLVVPRSGQTGLRRLALLVDIVLLVLDEVFADDLFPFSVKPVMLDTALSHYSPCLRCVSALPAGLGHAWHLYPVEQVVDAITQKTLSVVSACRQHPGISLRDLEQLAPDLLLNDVDVQYRFSEEELTAVSSDKQNDVLGTGGFAVVKAAYCEDRIVACKNYNPTYDVLSNYRDLRREVEVLSRFSLHFEEPDDNDTPNARHPAADFFVALFGVCLSPMTLLLEMAPFGAMNSVLQDHYHELSRPYLATVAAEVATGIRALHSASVVSRDIKAGNVLVYALDLGPGPHVKLADFGTAIVVPQCGIVKVIGTRNYQAPETQLDASRPRYGFAVDLFAFGLFLYELTSGNKAYSDVNAGPIMATIRSGKRPDVATVGYGAGVISATAAMCWREEVERRPLATTLHRHLAQPESLLLVDSVRFELDTSLRSAFVVTPPSPEFGRAQYLITVHRDSRAATRVRMEPLLGTVTQDVLASSHPDVPSKQLRRDVLPLDGHGRALACCVSPHSRRLWIGTDRRQLLVVSYAHVSLTRDDDVIALAGRPLSMVAGLSQVFIALDTGTLAMYPRDRRRSTESRAVGYRALPLDQSPLVALLIVYDSRLWCLTLRGTVHILSVSRRNEREVELEVPFDDDEGARGLALAHAPEQGLVWAAFRDSAKLAAWPDTTSQFSADASAAGGNEAPGGGGGRTALRPALVVDMSGDWAQAVSAARPLVGANIELDERRPRVRSIVAESDVLWVGTGVGIVLLYRLLQPEKVAACRRTRTSTFTRLRLERLSDGQRQDFHQRDRDYYSQESDQDEYLQHRQPEFLGWLYAHTGPNAVLSAARVTGDRGFAGQVVMSCGTGSPLFDPNGCFSLARDKSARQARDERFRGLFTASTRISGSGGGSPAAAATSPFSFGDDRTDGSADLFDDDARDRGESLAGDDDGVSSMPDTVESAEQFVEQLHGFPRPQYSPYGQSAEQQRDRSPFAPRPPGPTTTAAAVGRETTPGVRTRSPPLAGPRSQGRPLSASPITVAKAFAVDVASTSVVSEAATALESNWAAAVGADWPTVSTGVTLPQDRSIGVFDIDPVDTSNCTPSAADYAEDVVRGIAIVDLPGSGGVPVATTSADRRHGDAVAGDARCGGRDSRTDTTDNAARQDAAAATGVDGKDATTDAASSPPSDPVAPSSAAGSESDRRNLPLPMDTEYFAVLPGGARTPASPPTVEVTASAHSQEDTNREAEPVGNAAESRSPSGPEPAATSSGEAPCRASPTAATPQHCLSNETEPAGGSGTPVDDSMAGDESAHSAMTDNNHRSASSPGPQRRGLSPFGRSHGLLHSNAVTDDPSANVQMTSAEAEPETRVGSDAWSRGDQDSAACPLMQSPPGPAAGPTHGLNGVHTDGDRRGDGEAVAEPALENPGGAVALTDGTGLLVAGEGAVANGATLGVSSPGGGRRLEQNAVPDGGTHGTDERLRDSPSPPPSRVLHLDAAAATRAHANASRTTSSGAGNALVGHSAPMSITRGVARAGGTESSGESSQHSQLSSSRLSHRPKPGLMPLDADVPGDVVHPSTTSHATAGAGASPRRPTATATATSPRLSPPHVAVLRPAARADDDNDGDTIDGGQSTVEDGFVIIGDCPDITDNSAAERSQNAAAAAASSGFFGGLLKRTRKQGKRTGVASTDTGPTSSSSPSLPTMSVYTPGDIVVSEQRVDEGPFSTAPGPSEDTEEPREGISDLSEGFVLLQELEPCVLLWQACCADDMAKIFAVARRCQEPFAGYRPRS